LKNTSSDIVVIGGVVLVTAFVCITTKPAAMVEVLEALKKVGGVKEAEMVYGLYDIVAEVEGDSISSLKRIITERVRLINNVATTTTIMAVKA
jgi:DNA-binding Lrp family transcriptional regulator